MRNKRTILISALFMLFIYLPPVGQASNDEEFRLAYTKSDYSKAIKILSENIKSIEQSPNRSNTQNQSILYTKKNLLAHLYTIKLGDDKSALKIYEEMISMRKANPVLNYMFSVELLYIGDIYERKKDFTKAVEYYDQFLYELALIRNQIEDDASLILSMGLANIVSYHVDTLMTKLSITTTRKKRIEKISTIELILSNMAMQDTPYFMSPTVSFEDKEKAKKEYSKDISQNPASLLYLFINYPSMNSLLDTEKIKTDAKSEEIFYKEFAMDYIEKYENSYTSLILLANYHQIYIDEGDKVKADNILSSMKKIAQKQSVKLDVINIEYHNDTVPNDYSKGMKAYFKGEYDKAIKLLTVVLSQFPWHRDALRGRRMAWYKKGNFDRAAEDDSMRIKINPYNAYLYYSRGQVRQASKDCPSAIEDFTKAIEIDATISNFYRRKAWVLATCIDGKWRNGKEALQLIEKAEQIKVSPYNLNALAAAYAETGDFQKAISTMENLIKHIQEQNKTKNIEKFNKMLESYKAHKPWRE